MLKREAFAYTTLTGMKTSEIKNLIGGIVTNMHAARAARIGNVSKRIGNALQCIYNALKMH